MFELNIHDPADFLFGKSMENQRFINAVEKFRTEIISQFCKKLLFETFCITFIGKGHIAADIAGHDDNGIFEIDSPALRVRSDTVLKDLKKDIENIRMCFFNFIKQNDGIGTAADGFSQLSPLFVTDISRRRTDEAGNTEFFHIFGHINPDHGTLIIKEVLCKTFRKFGFTDTGGTEKDETGNRTVGVLKSGTGAQNGFGYR